MVSAAVGRAEGEVASTTSATAAEGAQVPMPVVFFDLDNTLYPEWAGVDDQMKARIKVRARAGTWQDAR